MLPVSDRQRRKGHKSFRRDRFSGYEKSRQAHDFQDPCDVVDLSFHAQPADLELGEHLARVGRVAHVVEGRGGVAARLLQQHVASGVLNGARTTSPAAPGGTFINI
ncbi:hypothetical protein EVAR_98858_1 [Eumeta japonica]|uniref:Uncharacterized protein n=1 Tax=Eumeta variegata TaxID=151549 RepID=A0A4C1Z8Q1_EUMVA|nr:hypothetical protein EVAR_98858_1 [Eumeta japonica]